ncbi:hypothetical protein IFM89_030644 [Coptis chinensis]|uniref:Uncharacterized protein n=1 Tax=Coptis chinensis TaxID=261450 RepID=A0A835IHJ1_9MAGN|nr:hypothetical protein IFM89_030644 [Coptis chinensis]
MKYCPPVPPPRSTIAKPLVPNGRTLASTRSRSELVGLAIELKNALDQLENKVNPLINKELEEIINEDHGSESGAKLIKEIVALASESVGSQSMEMLKVRASLEEKLKQKGIFSSVTNKLDINQKLHSRRLETLDDFGDEVMDKDSGNANLSNGRSSSMHSTKLLKVVAPKLTKLKVNNLVVFS